MPAIHEVKCSDFTEFTRMNRFGIGNDFVISKQLDYF